jgi:galactan 5-O-arabinofuranosyltransferase
MGRHGPQEPERSPVSTRFVPFVGEALAAVVVAVAVSAGVQWLVSRIDLPPGTQVPHAVGMTAAVVVVGSLVLLAVRGPRGWPSRIAAWALLSAASSAALALVLQGTRFYLGGVGSDQAFRTAFLTRLADSPALADMTYADLPPYYPTGWFWLGGRLAALTGTPAWEFYKPYAIGTLAVVAALSFSVWSLVRSRREALAAGVATLLVGIQLGSGEPYGWLVAAFVPPLAVVAVRAFRADRRHWLVLGGLGLAGGLAALCYTLYAGLLVVVVLVAAGLAVRRVRWTEVLLRLAIVGGVGVLLAAVHWGPYLVAAAADGFPGGAATRYLPASSTQLPLPMLQLTPLGLLTLAGTVWVLWAVRRSTTARALAVVVGVCWCWYGANTIALAFGHTTLAFRMEEVVDLALSVAGVCGVAEVLRRVPTRPAVAAVAVLGFAAPVGSLQALGTDQASLTSYYPTGETAQGVSDDTVPGRWAGALDTAVAELSGRRPDQVVLLSAVPEMTAFAPYHAFQADTPHYANPVGDYEERQALLHEWAAAPDLAAALDASPYPPPTAFVLRVDGDRLHLPTVVDRFPLDPNVGVDDVVFRASAFAGFATRTVGPYLVAVRR